MESKRHTLTCEEVKQKDMVDFLASIGFKPKKIIRNDYWYLSPLREEKTASFKINRKMNAWYDHGIGKGGSLIDFGILYFGCSVKELLAILQSNTPFHRTPSRESEPMKNIAEPQMKIIAEGDLSSIALFRYFKQRRIDEKIAIQYCREIEFELNNKCYKAIGFRNDEGGFELRNAWFKGSTSPKSITTISNGYKGLSVFEGFFDFLSYRTIYANEPLANGGFLILNSLSFLEMSRSFMEQHDKVRLYLDRDNPGISRTKQLIESGKKYSDESALYDGYKDINEWVQHIGKSQKYKHKIKI